MIFRKKGLNDRGRFSCVKCLCGAIVFLVLAVSPAVADIFVKRLPDGTLSYTNRPRGGDWDMYLKEKPSNRPAVYRRDEYDALIRQIALNEGMDPELIRGIVHVESRFNPRARSPKGAMGLMQLMPQTASLMGVVDPWDPHENLTAGVRYFSSLMKRYGGDVTKALAAYNAGPSAVDSYNGIPPYQETREYVKNVLAIFNGEGK